MVGAKKMENQNGGIVSDNWVNVGLNCFVGRFRGDFVATSWVRW